MAFLTPKEFIQQFYIDELEKLIGEHNYMAMIIMSVGIEFLGRCEHPDAKWFKDTLQQGGKKKEEGYYFKYAIEKIKAFDYYRSKGLKFKLYKYLRCGLVHTSLPSPDVTLSSKGEKPHLEVNENGSINIQVEEFHKEFKKACKQVISKIENNKYVGNSKMYQPILQVPHPKIDQSTTTPDNTFITESIKRNPDASGTNF